MSRGGRGNSQCKGPEVVKRDLPFAGDSKEVNACKAMSVKGSQRLHTPPMGFGSHSTCCEEPPEKWHALLCFKRPTQAALWRDFQGSERQAESREEAGSVTQARGPYHPPPPPRESESLNFPDRAQPDPEKVLERSSAGISSHFRGQHCPLGAILFWDERTPALKDHQPYCSSGLALSPWRH